MSFLLKGRKIFLFVFLLVLFFNFFTTANAQAVVPPVERENGTSIHPVSGITTDTATGKVLDDNQGSALDTLLNGVFGGSNWLLRAVSPVFEIISKILLTIAAVILGVASFIFDMFINIGVVGISDLVHAGGADSPVKKAWEIFRNIANIGLIFIVIFIAIGTILQTSGYEGKKLLGRVVVAALLMNFSFFLGAIVVDISNEMSLTVYDEIKKVTDAGSSQSANLGSYIWKNSGVAVFSTAAEKDVDGNTSGIFESTASASPWTGIQRIPVVAAFNIDGATDKIIYNATSSALGALAAVILAIVLLIASGKIMGRLIAILLLLVVSPIAFMSMILPSTQKVSSDWWKSIVGHSFYLPAFLLFIYVGLKMLEVFQKLDIDKYIEGINSSGTAQNGLAETIKIMTLASFAMGITIGLFIAAIIVANKISEGGSSAVGKISASVTSGFGGAAMAGGAFLGRNTIGAGATLASNSEWVKGGLRSMGPLGGVISKQLEGVAKTSFDARESRVFKGVASATGIGGDFVNNVKPAKDGFKGQTDRFAKSIKETYEAIPDKKMDGTTEKTNLEAAAKNLETQKEILKDARKDLAKGVITPAQFTAIQATHDGAEATEKTAKGDYDKAQNPTKQKFLSKTNPDLSIKNVWIAAPTNKAREVLTKESNLTDAEKLHKETMKALNDLKGAK